MLGTPGDQIEIHIAVRIYMARSGGTLNSKFGFIPGVTAFCDRFAVGCDRGARHRDAPVVGSAPVV